MKKDLGELQGKIFLHRWSLKKNNGTKWTSQAKLDRTKKFWDLFLRIFYCDYQRIIYLTREKCDQKMESFDYNAAIAVNGAILNETVSKNWARIPFKTRLTGLRKHPCEILSPNTFCIFWMKVLLQNRHNHFLCSVPEWRNPHQNHEIFISLQSVGNYSLKTRHYQQNFSTILITHLAETWS